MLKRCIAFASILLLMAAVIDLRALPGENEIAQQKGPTIMYSFLLNEMKIQPDGTVYFGFLRMLNLPVPPAKPGCRDCIMYPYNPNGGTPLTSTLMRDGKPLGKQTWTAENRGTYWTANAAGQSPKVPGVGSYEKVWDIDGKPFFRFPFRVIQGPRGLVAAGDWNDYGYLIFEGSNPSGQLRFTTWLLGDLVSTSDHTPELRIIKDSNEKPVAESNLNGVVQKLLPEWKRIDFRFVKPKPASGGYTGRDLLAVDGDYTLVVKINGADYGKYKFSVKGGEIVR